MTRSRRAATAVPIPSPLDAIRDLRTWLDARGIVITAVNCIAVLPDSWLVHMTRDGSSMVVRGEGPTLLDALEHAVSLAGVWEP